MFFFHIYLGSVTPLLDNGLGHASGVRLGVDTDLLGDLDAVGLLDKPEKLNKFNSFGSSGISH